MVNLSSLGQQLETSCGVGEFGIECRLLTIRNQTAERKQRKRLLKPNTNSTRLLDNDYFLCSIGS